MSYTIGGYTHALLHHSTGHLLGVARNVEHGDTGVIGDAWIFRKGYEETLFLDQYEVIHLGLASQAVREQVLWLVSERQRATC